MQLPRAGEWKRVGGLPARSCQPTRPARRSAAQVGALVAKASKLAPRTTRPMLGARHTLTTILARPQGTPAPPLRRECRRQGTYTGP